MSHEYKIAGNLSPEAATEALKRQGVVVDFIDPKELLQFRDLIGFAALAAINLPETDPRRDFIRQAGEFVRLIDSQA